MINPDGSRIYPTETQNFMQQLYMTTIKARGPFGIIRESQSNRSYGEPSSISWSVVKQEFQGGSPRAQLMRQKANERARRYRESEHGAVVGHLWDLEKCERGKKQRIERCSEYPVSVFGNKSALEIGKSTDFVSPRFSVF